MAKSISIEEKIGAAARKVYLALGPSLPEAVYQRALATELGCGLSMEVPCPIYFEGKLVGTCWADIVNFEEDYVVEVKTVIAAPVTEGKEAGQVGAYMRHLGIGRGAVVNFNWVREYPDVLFVYLKKEEA